MDFGYTRMATFPEFAGPSAEMAVQRAGDEDVVVLWRGTTPQVALLMEQKLSAGGGDPRPGCDAPTEDQVRLQVGGSRPGVRLQRLPEFTTNADVAKRFAGGRVVCIWIKRKYLCKGSVAEAGWVALPEAPLEEFRAAAYGKEGRAGWDGT